jgi:hypothetical protein
MDKTDPQYEQYKKLKEAILKKMDEIQQYDGTLQALEKANSLMGRTNRSGQLAKSQ